MTRIKTAALVRYIVWSLAFGLSGMLFGLKTIKASPKDTWHGLLLGIGIGLAVAGGIHGVTKLVAHAFSRRKKRVPESKGK